MKKALITGITGQDGSYLTELLLEKGYEVHGIIRRASTFNTQRIDDYYQDPHKEDIKLELHYGDMVDASNISRLVEKIEPDEIYNLAAQSHVAVLFEQPEYTADVDALGTLRLLDAIREARVNARFYQVSTSESSVKVCSYKDIFGQPKKTEYYDTYVVADLLRSKGDQLENTPQFDPVVQQAKKLSRTYKDLKEQTNRYVNQLNEVVGEYLPELFHDKFPNLTSKAILCLLHDCCSLSVLRKLEVDGLADFLVEKSQGYYGKDTAEILLDAVRSIGRSPLAKEAYQLKIKTLAN